MFVDDFGVLRIIYPRDYDVRLSPWGRLKLNIELLQTNCSDFRFNLTKVTIHNTCHVIVFPVGVFFSNLFMFNEIGCNKEDSMKKV